MLVLWNFEIVSSPNETVASLFSPPPRDWSSFCIFHQSNTISFNFSYIFKHFVSQYPKHRTQNLRNKKNRVSNRGFGTLRPSQIRDLPLQQIRASFFSEIYSSSPSHCSFHFSGLHVRFFMRTEKDSSCSLSFESFEAHLCCLALYRFSSIFSWIIW